MANADQVTLIPVQISPAQLKNAPIWNFYKIFSTPSGKKLYQCLTCDYETFSKSLLWNHLRKKHPSIVPASTVGPNKEKPISVPERKRKYVPPTKSGVRKHFKVLRVSGEIEFVECKHCPGFKCKVYKKSTGRLIYHMKTRHPTITIGKDCNILLKPLKILIILLLFCFIPPIQRSYR